MRFIPVLLCLGTLNAQIYTWNKEQMLKYTAQNPYERFDDGRPKVPDSVLEQVRSLSVEDVWGVVPRKGYPNQFEGNWQILHPDKKLVGRAVTAQFMPLRPDLGDVISADAKAQKRQGSQNQWVIDALQPGDVVVVDLFGKVEGGTFVGDNLAAAVLAASKTGMVINGGIRDLEGIYPMDMAAYFRGVHPSAINSVMLTGFNVPVRIGDATVVPGDVVFGDRTGVYFIPPQLVEEIVKRAEITRIHDVWTKEKFQTGKYKSSELYSTPRDPELRKEYEEYKKQQLEKNSQTTKPSR